MPKKTAAPRPQPLPPSRRGGMNGLRELTVTTLHRAARHGGRDEAVPYLRLSGRWLEQYGLTCGCRVVVSGEPGQLILTVDVAVGPSSTRG